MVVSCVPAGVFTVMTFFQAIMWLNITASALVQLCVILGVIFGVKPALLGATVLAYGELQHHSGAVPSQCDTRFSCNQAAQGWNSPVCTEMSRFAVCRAITSAEGQLCSCADRLYYSFLLCTADLVCRRSIITVLTCGITAGLDFRQKLVLAALLQGTPYLT